jgi:opacity protein-like surface antigen
MKKFILTAVAAIALATPALAADMKVTAPAAPPNPWDVAFGGGITSDYIFRGITQSNHRPSVTAYFEPRYNVTNTNPQIE